MQPSQREQPLATCGVRKLRRRLAIGGPARPAARHPQRPARIPATPRRLPPSGTTKHRAGAPHPSGGRSPACDV